MDIPTIFTTIGSTLGVPATLVLFYLHERLRKVERDNEVLKGTLGDIKSDLSYVRGRMESKDD